MESDGDPLTGPRLFGGFAFRSDFTPDNTWSIYAPAFFVLPHYQLVSRSGQMWLTINTQIPLDEMPAPRSSPTCRRRCARKSRN